MDIKESAETFRDLELIFEQVDFMDNVPRGLIFIVRL